MKNGKLFLGLGVLGGVSALLFLGKGKAVVPSDGGPAPPLPGSQVSYVTTATMVKLQNGTNYQGRIALQDLLPFVASASAETIAQGLFALGFQHIQVFMSVSELPANWPRETVTNADANTRWFAAQWNGPSGLLPRPAQLEKVWVAPS